MTNGVCMAMPNMAFADIYKIINANTNELRNINTNSDRHDVCHV